MTNYVVHTDHGPFNVKADNAVIHDRGHLTFEVVMKEADGIGGHNVCIQVVAAFSAGNWNRVEIQEDTAK